MAQDASAVSSQHVRQAFKTMEGRDQQVLGNVDFLAASMNTAGEYLAALNDSDKAAAYKEVMQKLGQFAHEVQAHKALMAQLAEDYQAGPDETDFRALLDQSLKASLEQRPYNPRTDPKLAEFIAALGGEAGSGDGEGNGDGEGGDDMDDDLQVVNEDGGRDWLNKKCPLSMVPAIDLRDPVKDSKGYVYERAVVMEYLRRHATIGGGAKHPVAGVREPLVATELVEATEVVREKRRRRLAETLGADVGNGPNGARGGNDGDFIDV
ncbi:hypothetical protein GPECTOR_24g287 [Gonium pectorale]|uniref:U-box domain-containing protein n=1 Tax=Gonium pectorale TaxID=33097 RepID=A0A150GGN4_GONPE|nr:hypothetical protein GPECTOR_24g287 [Gonium pectorale]|eukprot:KXZ48997.1 hypothetical protein GPECTOR_24g287 [Gonium pectorale]